LNKSVHNRPHNWLPEERRDGTRKEKESEKEGAVLSLLQDKLELCCSSTLLESPARLAAQPAAQLTAWLPAGLAAQHAA